MNTYERQNNLQISDIFTNIVKFITTIACLQLKKLLLINSFLIFSINSLWETVFYIFKLSHQTNVFLSTFMVKKIRKCILLELILRKKSLFVFLETTPLTRPFILKLCRPKTCFIFVVCFGDLLSKCSWIILSWIHDFPNGQTSKVVLQF